MLFCMAAAPCDSEGKVTSVNDLRVKVFLNRLPAGVTFPAPVSKACSGHTPRSPLSETPVQNKDLCQAETPWNNFYGELSP